MNNLIFNNKRTIRNYLLKKKLFNNIYILKRYNIHFFDIHIGFP